MGEVFRARDTRLDRDVAIKVLSRELGRDAQLKARFAREAKAISALAHPHICVLHDIGSDNGIDYLVMELVQGESLADRLQRGPLRLDDALRYAIDIAGALAHAHEAGITHRDLKPGNIMITKSGAKVLDFGLAKFNSAFVTTMAPGEKPLTEEGTVLGTLQYMAPEQLEGLEADARTDIFAFGAVLYEMITGRRAFEGGTRISLIAAILEKDPAPLASIQPATPSALDHIVRVCLSKNPDERFQSARDIALQLGWIARERSGSGAIPAGSIPHRRRQLLPWSITAVAVLAAIAAGVMAVRNTHVPTRRFVRQTTLSTEGSAPIGISAEIFTVSPDGQTIAYLGLRDAPATEATAFLAAAPKQLYLRRLDSAVATAIAGTEGADSSPFFSPDGEWIAFGSEHKLKKVSLKSGAVLTICDAQSLRGGVWGPDDTIVFAVSTGPLLRVAASGGTPAAITRIDEHSREYSHRFPELLPGGKTILFTSLGSGFAWIDAMQLETKQRRRILRGVRARYDRAGHLVVASEGILRAHRFDVDTLQVSGEPVVITNSLLTSDVFGFANFALLPDGAAIFLPSNHTQSQIVSYDRSGHPTQLSGEAREYGTIHFSPDGKRVVADEGNGNLWLCDVDRAKCTRATDDEQSVAPIWSNDGLRIISRCGTGTDLCEASVDTLARRKTLMKSIALWPISGPYAVTRDDREILFCIQESRKSWDLWVARREGPGVAPLIVSMENENQPSLSPNEDWIAYCVDGTDIVVQRYPPAGRKWTVSHEAANSPVWRGGTIYYAAGKQIMAVDVSGKTELSIGQPRVLFTAAASVPEFDVSPDAQHFVMTIPLLKPSLRFNIVEGLLGNESRAALH